MKKDLWIGIMALVLVVPGLYALGATGRSNQYVRGTLVDVQKRKVYFRDYTMGGSNPSDAPSTSRYYAYEVSGRVDCKTYIGRYETPFNYLRSVFNAQQPVQVRLTKHVMYFDLPNDPDMRMRIIRRSSDCDPNR